MTTLNNWNNLPYTAFYVAVGTLRALYHTTIFQHLVCFVQYNITIGLNINILVTAFKAATNYILSIQSPTIAMEVNGTTASATSTICSISSSPSSNAYYTTHRHTQQDERRIIIVEETLIIDSQATYYKPTEDAFIMSITMELHTKMKKNAETMRIKATPPKPCQYYQMCCQHN